MQNLTIRPMQSSDISSLSAQFRAQSWEGREEILSQYLKEQEQGERLAFVALVGQELAGYVTILKLASHGPFQGEWPEIADFNVFEKFQSQGIGTALIEHAEQRIKKFSSIATIGVGLHAGYGPAQRLYIKRGYIPDGSGAWYQDQPLALHQACPNTDELVLFLSKIL